jgi:hypothetical protein
MLLLEVTNSLTVEELLKILGVLVIPLIGAVVWTTTIMFSMKADIKSLETMVKALKDSDNARIDRLEKNVGEIRNLITALLISFAKNNIKVETFDERNKDV